MSPLKRRDRPVLVFDGDCGLCTSSVRFLERHVALRAEHEVLWVDRPGRVSGGADAVGRLLTGAGGA